MLKVSKTLRQILAFLMRSWSLCATLSRSWTSFKMIWRGLNETVPVKRSVAMVEDTKAMVWRLKCVMFEHELTNYYDHDGDRDDGNDGPSDLNAYNSKCMKVQLDLSTLDDD